MKKTLTLLLLLAGLTLQARAVELTWNGSEDHMTWNTDAGNTNWKSGDTETAYINGSGVTFEDAGCGEVTLVGELAPANVWVSNSPGSDYTFTGEGKIAGDSCTLTKYGEGRLTINTANSFHATTLNAGTLALGNAAALGSGYITLNGGTLDLGNQTIDNEVSVRGNACIGNGAFNGVLGASSGTTLTLCGDLEGKGWISPGLNFTLNLGSKTLSNDVNLSFDASIGNGTLNGKVIVGQTLTVFGETHIGESGTVSAGGTISLADNATLDLGGKALSNAITLQGNATIGNGTINSGLTLMADKTLTLCGDLKSQNQNWIYLNNNSTLDLGNHTLSKGVYLQGSASIGNGTLAKEHDVDVSSGNTLTLCGDLKGEGWILLDSASTLDLNGKTLSNAVVVKGDVRIGNGTLNGVVNVDAVTPSKTIAFFGKTHLKGGTITPGSTTIKALKEDKEGLLQELGVSDGLIAGTDRQASLADGLEISRMGDNLELQDLILTDNNRISVGDGNTITLNNVTIKISNAIYSQMATGEYIFLLKDLFHCSVDMTDVTFDASELHLPESFNPATDSISFDLGDAKLTEATAGQNITLLMGGYGSQTMSINGYGRPVFTKLVETPEPATGTLSLLALAGLCARRRRK